MNSALPEGKNVGLEPVVGPKPRAGCPDLDPNWPGMFGKPRGPTLCVLYPSCTCGYADGHRKQGFREAMDLHEKIARPNAN